MIYIKEKLINDILKFSQELYRNRYFLVVKKNSDKYRFINNIQSLNKVIIHDFEMSLLMNKFLKDFVEYSIIFIVDYFADYYQISLDRFSRDLIAFMSLLKLVRMTRLSQD